MANKKLGEILMESGVITPSQLELALRNQLMLGGHLGTCLLELGLIDEDLLGRTLSENLGVPYAAPNVFERIEESVVNAFSKKVVEGYRAVPFASDHTRLDVAMMNPLDLDTLDALAFASGCRIRPWVSPEVRLFEAMEKIYGVPRRLRYVAISRSMSPLDVAVHQTQGDAQRTAEISIDEETIGGNGSTSASPGEEYGYGRSWLEIAEELSAKRSLADSDETGGDLERLAGKLCGATDRDHLSRAVLSHLTTIMERAMLFAVKSDQVRYWDSAGMEVDTDALGAERFSIAKLSLLEHLRGEDLYRGPLGDDPRHLAFYRTLGIRPPREILLVPVHINDRLTAIILGDGGPSGSVGGDTQGYLNLARMLGLGLNLVIFKKKIREIVSLATQTT